ncbi:MAG: GNAT family N-acetyltransferase [Byssovorax sp.]
MIVLETERLALRRMVAADAAFILALLNEPGFLQNIGDRGVRSLDDAVGYIANGPVKSYAERGFGLYVVELRATRAPIGICGLIKRESLDDVDIGFAFLERYWQQGYGHESAAAVMDEGRRMHGLRRIVAITAPHNQGSIRILEKVGHRFERTIRMPGEDHDILFMAWDAEPSSA